jgi:F-type H+-transporting ATPase subunit a
MLVKLNYLLLDVDQEFPAGVEKQIPELPNFIKLIYHSFQENVLTIFLYQWESIIFSIMISTLLCLFFILSIRKKKMIPSGLQNFIEWVATILKDVLINVLGKEGIKYVPFLGTLFIYIFIMNIFGMIPLMHSPSANINVTLGLAICVFGLVQFLNIKHMGVGGYLYHMAGSPKGLLGWAIVPLLLPIELITQISRPVTLALRLFGNILGEDILVGAFALFGVTLVATYHWPIGLPLQIPFIFFAVLASFMQAMVFSLLSTIYILLSMQDTHEHEHH